MCPKCYVILYWGWLPIVNTFRNVLGSLAVPSCTGGVCDSRCHFVWTSIDFGMGWYRGVPSSHFMFARARPLQARMTHTALMTDLNL